MGQFNQAGQLISSFSWRMLGQGSVIHVFNTTNVKNMHLHQSVAYVGSMWPSWGSLTSPGSACLHYLGFMWGQVALLGQFN